jgi:hypothetical protein
MILKMILKGTLPHSARSDERDGAILCYWSEAGSQSLARSAGLVLLERTGNFHAEHLVRKSNPSAASKIHWGARWAKAT